MLLWSAPESGNKISCRVCGLSLQKGQEEMTGRESWSVERKDFTLPMREHHQEEFVGRNCFPEAFIGCVGYFGSCSDSTCVITARTVFCQRPIEFQRVLCLVSYCWHCTKLSGVLRKKGSCDGEEGGRGIEERIKINMQVSLCAFWSVDLRGERGERKLKIMQRNCCFS